MSIDIPDSSYTHRADYEEKPVVKRKGMQTRASQVKASQTIAGKRIKASIEVDSNQDAKKTKVTRTAKETFKASASSDTDSKLKQKITKRSRADLKGEELQEKTEKFASKAANLKKIKDAFADIREMACHPQSVKTVAAFIKNIKKQIESQEDITLEPYVTFKAFIDRYEQLANLPNFEKKKLVPQERLQLAYHIEIEIPKIKDVADGVFISSKPTVRNKRSSAVVAPPPRDIFVTKKGRIFLLAIPELSKIAAKGSYKEVFSAVKLYKVGTQIISKKTNSLKTEQTVKPQVQARIPLEDKGEIEDLDREMGYYMRLKAAKIPGIAALRFYTDITGKKESKEDYVHFFKPKAEEYIRFKLAAFSQYEGSIDKKDAFTLTEKIHVFADLASTVEQIHRQGVIHGDLKSDNILYKRGEERPITGVIDFGLSFDDEGVNTKFPEHTFGAGGYGTRFATAPELIGNKKFQGDIKKIEVWALGIAFYEVYFQTQVSWRASIPAPEIFIDLPMKKRNVIYAHVQKQIEAFGNDIAARLEILEAKKKRTQDEAVELVICKMLQLDPAKRLNLAQAHEEFGKLNK